MKSDLTTILETHKRIRPYIRHTPLIYSPYLSAKANGNVWLKCENQQPTGSFKVRGALNKISNLTDQEKAKGIVAASAGNHALGVAHAVKSLGNIQADIFVPTTAPNAKINKLGRFPITIHQVGETYEDAHEAAVQFQTETGGTAISAYDDVAVIAGQGTIGLEIFADCPQVDMIVVPVGGGGVIAGITAVSRAINPSCTIIGLQPTASPAAQLSLKAGHAIDPYKHEPTIADGLAGGFGKVPFGVIKQFPPEMMLATEAEMRSAIYTLVQQHQQIIEPSGAIAITPFLNGNINLDGKTAVCVLTGGNLDTKLLQEILNEFNI